MNDLCKQWGKEGHACHLTEPPADSELWNSQIRLYDRDDSAAANRLFAVQSTDVCHKLISRINLHAVSSGRDSRREETRNDRTDEKEKGKQPQRDAKCGF